jgi:DNA polymerase III sliding clamp (beta) subunit (PCNA family)
MATAKDINKAKTVNGKVVVKASSNGVKPETKKADLKVVPKPQSIDTQKLAEDKKQKGEKPVTLTFGRESFEKDISVAANFTAKKGTMPVLTHILIDSDGQGHCRIMSTDLQVSWTKVTKCKGPKMKKGVPAALLLKEVKALPADVRDVVLEFKDDTVGINGRCNLFTLSGDEFPEKPDIKKWTGLYIDSFIGGLQKVSVAMGQDDTRYQLNGVYLDFDMKRLVATDGHRLHFEDIRVRGDKAQSLIVPSRAVGLMLRYPLTEIPRLAREKGKPKVGESIDKLFTCDLDVFGHKVKAKYEPQLHKSKIINASVELQGPVSEGGYHRGYITADVLKSEIAESGSLKEWLQVRAEDKYLDFNKTVFITVNEKFMTYPVAGGEMLIKAIEGNFPKYADIIPKSNPIKVKFGTADFLQNMNGVIPLNNESVVLKINSHLVIHTHSPERGEYKWQIPCKAEGKDKGTIDIAFDGRYLIDAIKAYGAQDVLLEIKAPENGKKHCEGPTVVNKKAIVMPRRM